MKKNTSKFVKANTKIQRTNLVPEIELHLACKGVDFWQINNKDLTDSNLTLPYWAFAWAGGQALARFFIDNWEVVRNKRILDVGSGSGIESIAACIAGARFVTAADIDPYAISATKLNSRLNGMKIDTWLGNPIGCFGCWDTVVVGDLFFEQPLANKLETWLRELFYDGTEIYIGDPQRTFLPKNGIEKIVTYKVEATSELEDSGLSSASVWRMV